MKNRIREQRNKHGLTQEVLADKAGISRSHLSEIESGKKRAHQDHLIKIADVLGISPRELLPEDDPLWGKLLDIAGELDSANVDRLLDYGSTLLSAQRASQSQQQKTAAAPQAQAQKK